jgi:hypothetical protein
VDCDPHAGVALRQSYFAVLKAMHSAVGIMHPALAIAVRKTGDEMQG